MSECREMSLMPQASQLRGAAPAGAGGDQCHLGRSSHRLVSLCRRDRGRGMIYRA